MSERHTQGASGGERVRSSPGTRARIARVGTPPQVAYEWRARRYPDAEAALAAAEAQWGEPRRARGWLPREATPDGQAIPYAPYQPPGESRRAYHKRSAPAGDLPVAPSRKIPAGQAAAQEPQGAAAEPGAAARLPSLLAALNDVPRCASCGYTTAKCGGACG
jgi:hypothetical protein